MSPSPATPPVAAPPSGNDARAEVQLLAGAGELAIALALYSAIKGWTLGTALADPPAGSQDPGVLAYQDAKAAIFREAREFETWIAGSLGNAAYWAVPPNLGAGPGNPPPPSGGGGGAPLTAGSVAAVLLPAIQTLLANPTQSAALLAMLQKAMTGGTVTPPTPPPASGGTPTVAP